MTKPKSSRPGLKKARLQRGWSQAQAAVEIGVATSTWARWERGEIDPQAHQRKRLAEVFGADPRQVTAWVDEKSDDLPLPWLGEGIAQSSLAAMVETAAELWRWDVEPSRRVILNALPFVPAALSEWLLSYTLDPGLDSRTHTKASGRAVGLEDVHRLRDAIDAFAAMDHLHGGGLVRPAIVAYLDTEVAPLLKGNYSEEVGSQLMTAAAVMTGLAGWEAYDLARHGLAQAHYGQALRLARAADDPLTAAWVLTTLAQQAIDLEHPEWAIRLARAGRQAGRKARACPRVEAKLLLREARATALAVHLADTPDAHTVSRAERLLGEVEESFARISSSDDEPHWVHDLGHAELAAETGCAWRLLGRHQRAEACADFALNGFAAGFTRSRQFNLVHRAEALAGRGELDAAITSARQAVPMASNLTSARSIRLVREFDRQLEAHRTEPRVREWRDYLRSALPSAA